MTHPLFLLRGFATCSTRYEAERRIMSGHPGLDNLPGKTNQTDRYAPEGIGNKSVAGKRMKSKAQQQPAVNAACKDRVETLVAVQRRQPENNHN